MSNRFDAALTAISLKLDAKSTTQWPVIWGGLGVLMTVLMAVGTALYMPIQRDTGRLDVAVAAILDRGVFTRQYDADQSRVADLLRQMRGDVNSTVQQQRYNTDRTADTERHENLRLRSYDQHGRLTALEAESKNAAARIDTISKRLAEFIRDQGKH